MMKVWTSSLSGTALDWAVAKCEEPTLTLETFNKEWERYNYAASIDWAQAGPIIEKQEIALEPMTHNEHGDGWLATLANGSAVCMEFGPTMLVAAMRCYVLSRLGDEIEVPDELLPNNVRPNETTEVTQ